MSWPNAFAENADHFVIRMIVMAHLGIGSKQVESARERIKARYNVLKEQ